MLPHAPGVQMANIPEDGVTLKEDTDDANPDKRNPQALKDKQIEADNEFEDPKSGNKDISNGKEDEAMDTSEAKETTPTTNNSASSPSASSPANTFHLLLIIANKSL
ncbi:Histone deacetylase, partial [Caligus rogercresseyi]